MPTPNKYSADGRLYGPGNPRPTSVGRYLYKVYRKAESKALAKRTAREH